MSCSNTHVEQLEGHSQVQPRTKALSRDASAESATAVLGSGLHAHWLRVNTHGLVFVFSRKELTS